MIITIFFISFIFALVIGYYSRNKTEKNTVRGENNKTETRGENNKTETRGENNKTETRGENNNVSRKMTVREANNNVSRKMTTAKNMTLENILSHASSRKNRRSSPVSYLLSFIKISCDVYENELLRKEFRKNVYNIIIKINDHDIIKYLDTGLYDTIYEALSIGMSCGDLHVIAHELSKEIKTYDRIFYRYNKRLKYIIKYI